MSADRISRVASSQRCADGYHTFIDAGGIRWGVEARLLGEGADAIPIGFAFTSQRGEHRALDGCTPDCLSWEQFRDPEWCELLVASRLVRPAAPRTTRPPLRTARRSRLW